MKQKTYHDWSAERVVFCRQCGLPFENVRDYLKTQRVRKRDDGKELEPGCPRCFTQSGWITQFEAKFAMDDEHFSFTFKADGIAQLREDSADERGDGQEETFSWYGSAEWFRELKLLANAYEYWCEGFRPEKFEELEDFLVRVILIKTR